MNRFLYALFAVVFYTLILGGSFLFWQDKFQASSISPKLNVGENKNAIILLFVGDIMLDRGVEFYSKQNNTWKWPFLRIADYMQNADLVFANLESVISNRGEKEGSIYSFRAEPKSIEGLSFAGIDIVSVANNHSMDYGIEAFLDSMQRLKEAGIIPVGGGANKKQAYAPRIETIRGTTIGILAYTTLGSPFWQAGEKTPGIA